MLQTAPAFLSAVASVKYLILIIAESIHVINEIMEKTVIITMKSV
ncbi:hypothetical protein HMPREF1548_02235 [Clostridium sp. KLE 1755]|nr:hypothetical protein HMPREF1548_02235 [Clostridium sp. KLE 1755]